ncbi:histidine kinase, partial [bacterium SCGC AG-212-C10]
GYPLACMFEVYVLGHIMWYSAGVGLLTIIALPAFIAVAMLRHDLYDVDKALAAAVTYTLATGVLVALFLATAVAGGAALGGNSAVAAAIATAITASALAPVRRVAQRRVDQRLFPVRAAALTAIRSLEQRTRSGEARPEQLESELRAALRDPGLRVAYHLPGGAGFVDSAGTPVDPERAVPITMDGIGVGALIPASDGVSDGLLREIAHAAGTLVEIVRLRVELRAAVRELEQSRARLVQVGDEERRRLERDLHDGAQQRLVSLGMSLRVAQRHLSGGTVDLDALIDQSVAELSTAVAELRQIAHGLRPSRLDDGLPTALLALSRNLPLPVELDVTPATLPDPVATTIYFVASEALANAIKHASATQIGVRVSECPEGVEVQVRDNGSGGAVLRYGSGLSGLRDRVSALGGSFTVDSAAGSGTTVMAVLPCAS